jgi:hypothetical protein
MEREVKVEYICPECNRVFSQEEVNEMELLQNEINDYEYFCPDGGVLKWRLAWI